jgi:TRAP-type C4-dicarboxylate transport system substrate-binding protein
MFAKLNFIGRLAPVAAVIIFGVAGWLGVAGPGQAEPTAENPLVLKVHHFLPPQSTTHSKLLVPWKEQLEDASGGRISVELYPAMQLGGKPPQLLDQARNGVVDVVWTLPGYTPGRFPKLSVFELPFMVSTAEATSQAVHSYLDEYAREEFAGLHVLFAHTHERGVIHTKDKAVTELSDLRALTLRAPNRQIGNALAELGASPVFMPVPAIPEAVSRGTIDGAVIPWEVVPALKFQELTAHHVETPGPRGLYTAIFVLAMNEATYKAMPDDLRAVLDAHSGLEMAKSAGALWDVEGAANREMVAGRGNSIVEFSSADMSAIRTATQKVVDQWIEARGDDGPALYEAANRYLTEFDAGQ